MTDIYNEIKFLEKNRKKYVNSEKLPQKGIVYAIEHLFIDVAIFLSHPQNKKNYIIRFNLNTLPTITLFHTTHKQR